MIELARALKAGPAPRRSVLFVATTAEEHGLLGAEYYAAHPAVPLRATVGGVNLDTIALRGRGAKLGIIGRGLTTLDPIIRDVARAQGRELLDDSSRSEEHTSELQSLMRISYAVFCLKKKHTRS